MTAIAKKITPAPSAPPKATAEPMSLAALKAEAEPLAARLSQAEAALAALDTTPAQQGGESVSVEAAIATRKAGVQKRADLTAERDVLAERLTPLRARIAELEAEEQERRKIAEREESLSLGRKALERVRAAREALNEEIANFAAIASRVPVRFRMLPEMHFEADAESGEIMTSARRLSGATN
ncbi:MAG: hypothetical protein DI556_21955 [Rhodovulum sulfidophilum]|uniref:Uncharacterized protein n=1 Tax=Rhodovulum sulfidophilum TaxID=35806 RepID=A0A2W5MYH7_RHOSU|nr:MAG: hypothetical protein DI556_21955 [Rhodovulum sulfidophilum]